MGKIHDQTGLNPEFDQFLRRLRERSYTPLEKELILSRVEVAIHVEGIECDVPTKKDDTGQETIHIYPETEWQRTR